MLRKPRPPHLPDRSPRACAKADGSKHFKPEYCRGCFAGCCTLPVRVDAEDLHHMGFIRHDQVNGPLKRIASRLKREETIASYNDHTRTFVLKQRPNHDCVFLDSNRLCKIYDRRPAVCREFPKNSIRPNHCPATRKEGPPSHD
ncbi:MAG: YkgJ family cysteine cluster protein [Deltaproteobacteria bacterium]|nr:YkgJ family cysteine cluster protein [Deltaproteobacteria bacterium]